MQKIKKEELIQRINTYLKQKEEEHKELLSKKPDSVEDKQIIVLNNISVFSRDTDGYINATQLCKAGKVRFADWKRLEKTKALIQALENETQIPVSQLLDVKKGNTQKYSQGSWIHPDLAVQLAQWISPFFAIQVSKWREFAVTGEKISQQILDLQKEISQLQKDKKTIEKKHEKLLYRRPYHKFKKGTCFYILSDSETNVTKYKVGFEGVSINDRIKSHQTTLPSSRLEFLAYHPKSKLVEDCILQRYDENRQPYQNHEYIYDVELKQLIADVKTCSNFLNIQLHIEEDIEKYNE